MPEGVTSSPVTQRTQLSLEAPESQPSATTTPAPKPIIQPSGSSLVIPVATVSGGKTYVTIAPSAHLENSGTILVTPEGGGPTLGIVGSEIVELPANTKTAGNHHGQDDSGSNAGSNGNVDQQSPGTILVGDTPLTAGGSPVTMDGTTYSLEPTGSAVVINGITVSFSTNSRGQIVPVETASGQSDSGTRDADTEALGKLSVVSAIATATSEGAQDIASASSRTASGTNGSPEETGSGGSSSNNNDDADAEATGTNTSEDAPEMQSDNAGTAIAAQWPLLAILGAVGLLAAMA